MDWRCTMNFLLLLTVGSLINTVIQGTEIELEVPNTVEACEEATVTIYCNFQKGEIGLKKKWCYRKEHTGKDYNKCQERTVNTSDIRFHENDGKTWSNLTIKDATISDSGYYYCVVIKDTPKLEGFYSNGTHLTISPKNDYYNTSSTSIFSTTCETSTTFQDNGAAAWWMWVAPVVGSAVLIIALAVTWVLCCRKQDSPIYENTRTQETQRRLAKMDQSPRLEKDKTMKERDNRRPHNYEYRPRAKHLSP